MENRPSKTITEIMELAKIEALKSGMYYKHGAVIFRGKDIISVGHNFDFGQQIIHGKFSVHAEVDAIMNASKAKKSVKGATMVVARIAWMRNNVFGNSKPCDNCAEFIIKNKICTVFYTN